MTRSISPSDATEHTDCSNTSYVKHILLISMYYTDEHIVRYSAQ